jgi:hypothetical protein
LKESKKPDRKREPYALSESIEESMDSQDDVVALFCKKRNLSNFVQQQKE